MCREAVALLLLSCLSELLMSLSYSIQDPQLSVFKVMLFVAVGASCIMCCLLGKSSPCFMFAAALAQAAIGIR